MVSTIGIILVAAGALAIYLAHPNQVLASRTLPRTAKWSGGVALLLGLAILLSWAGPATAVFIAITDAMLVWTLVPLAAAWLRGPKLP